MQRFSRDYASSALLRFGLKASSATPHVSAILRRMSTRACDDLPAPDLALERRDSFLHDRVRHVGTYTTQSMVQGVSGWTIAAL